MDGHYTRYIGDLYEETRYYLHSDLYPEGWDRASRGDILIARRDWWKETLKHPEFICLFEAKWDYSDPYLKRAAVVAYTDTDKRCYTKFDYGYASDFTKEMTPCSENIAFNALHGTWKAQYYDSKSGAVTDVSIYLNADLTAKRIVCA